MPLYRLSNICDRVVWPDTQHCCPEYRSGQQCCRLRSSADNKKVVEILLVGTDSQHELATLMPANFQNLKMAEDWRCKAEDRFQLVKDSAFTVNRQSCKIHKLKQLILPKLFLFAFFCVLKKKCGKMSKGIDFSYCNT